MKALIVAILGGAALVVFALGIGVGIWFSQNYRIVPIGTPVTGTAEALRTAAEQYSPPPVEPAYVPAEPTTFKTAPATIAPPTPPAASAASTVSKSPFSYRFVPRETLHYALDAKIQGAGIDLGQGSKIDMDFGSQLALRTESVDPSGAGNLALNFENTDMTGTFMGSPVELHQRPDGTQLKMNSATKIDSDLGISLGLIPQLEFFKQTLRMNVARDGEIRSVSGIEGFDQMLSSMTKLPSDAMEATGLRPNAEWASQFLMPVPGIGTGVKTVTRNTFTGYASVDGHRCAVVQQTMDSSQTNGTLTAQSGGLGALGDALGFAMPLFSVVGRNTIYFDITNGKLVRCDLNLEFNLQLGQQLKSLTGLMRSYEDVFGDVFGGSPGKAGGKPATKSQVSQDMGVKIIGTLKLRQ